MSKTVPDNFTANLARIAGEARAIMGEPRRRYELRGRGEFEGRNFPALRVKHLSKDLAYCEDKEGNGLYLRRDVDGNFSKGEYVLCVKEPGRGGRFVPFTGNRS